MTGFSIEIDGRALSHQLLPLLAIANNQFLPKDTVSTLRVLPVSGIGFQPGSGIVCDFNFQVDRAGHVQYDADLDACLSGRGTGTLVLHGYPLLLDATASASAYVGISNNGLMSPANSRYLFVVMMPATYTVQTSTPWPGSFQLHPSGQVTVTATPAGALTVTTLPRVQVHNI